MSACAWALPIPGTCVQYPCLQGGGALGDESTPGTPADSIAASAHGGTYSHVAVAGKTWGGEKGAAAGTAAAAARRRRATPTGGAFTLPRNAPLIATLDGRPTGRRNRSRRAGTITRVSSRARSTPVVAARGRRAQLGGAQDFKFRAKEPIQEFSGSRGQNSMYGLWVRSCPALFQTTQVPMTNDLWWTGSGQFVESAIRRKLG